MKLFRSIVLILFSITISPLNAMNAKEAVKSDITLTPENRNGYTQLHLAAKNGEVTTIRSLLAKKAAVDAPDIFGLTPLHVAAFHGQVEAARVLIQEGYANIDAQDKWGKTPAYWAACTGRLAMVKFLWSREANVNIGSLCKTTPLHEAAFADQKDVVCFLVQNHATSINAQNNKQWTPLHTAVLGGSVGIVKFLVEYGANISAKTDENKTPLDLAKKKLDDLQPASQSTVLQPLNAADANLRTRLLEIKAYLEAALEKQQEIWQKLRLSLSVSRVSKPRAPTKKDPESASCVLSILDPNTLV